MSKLSGNCAVCAQPTIRKCASCKIIYYCCEQHQMDNWKDHKDICRPYEVCRDDNLGRYLRATRRLSRGDLIFSEAPLVIGPKTLKSENVPIVCVGCCRIISVDNLKQCSACFWPACDQNCAGLQDKFKHGLECRVLRIKSKTPETSFFDFYRFDILVPLRAILLQKISKRKYSLMLQLESHLDKRKFDTELSELINEKATFLIDNYLVHTDNIEYSHEIISKIYAIFAVNATELSDEIHAELLYPTASLLEHNCTPNTRQIISNSKITLKAALDIDQGANITSIYTHILWGTQARRRHLNSTKYFWCNCKRCADPTEFGTNLSALKCLNFDNSCTGFQLPLNPLIEDPNEIIWCCNKCAIRVPNIDISPFIDHLNDEIDAILSSKPNLKQLEDLLEKSLKFLHESHYLVYSIKHCLVQLVGDFERKLKICEELIGVTRKLDPGNSRLSLYLAVLLLELFRVKLERFKRGLCEVDDVKQVLDEAKLVLEDEKFSGAGLKLFAVVLKREEELNLVLNE